MKNYIIGTLAVAILILCSLIYKIETSSRYQHKFPVQREGRGENTEATFYLYLFFSKENCIDCLEVIEVLNKLPPHSYCVIGVVPESELKDESEVRRITGAKFPLISSQKYQKFIPWYSPTITGVSPNGDIMFVLPGLPGEKTYLETFLDVLYIKFSPAFY